jgi:hypothetical protein
VSEFLSEPVIRILLPARLKALELDHAYFEVREDFTYRSDLFGDRTVRAGFISDLASIPRAALGYLNSDDPRISGISIVHDWEYTHQSLDRIDCDRLLREGMLTLGARPTMAWLVYRSVRLFGGGHWK